MKTYTKVIDRNDVSTIIDNSQYDYHDMIDGHTKLVLTDYHPSKKEIKLM